MNKLKLVGAIAAIGAVVTLLGVGIDKLVRSTVQSQQQGQRYVVSLGDSVAAGAGLNAGSGRNTSNSCDTSSLSYPYLVGAQLHEQTEQFACSGATITKSATGSNNNVVSGQLPNAASFMPNSDVVITVGANDIGWLGALVSCATSTCPSADDPALVSKIQAMQRNLTDLLHQVQQQHPHRVVVNTYYQLLGQNSACVAGFGITPAKAAAIGSLEAVMNGAIAAAAHTGNAMLVQPDFSGHTLCDTEPWVQDLRNAVPLHPTATGQQQIARQDAAVLR